MRRLAGLGVPRIDQLRPDLVVVTSSTNYLGMLEQHELVQ